VTFLTLLTYKSPAGSAAREFPFALPVIRKLRALEFTAPVTLLVGENGTGKSTLLEALACAANSVSVGAESLRADRTLAHARALAKCFRLSWAKKTYKGFFLRAEDFFGYAKATARLRSEMKQRLNEIDEEYRGRSETARGYAIMPFAGSLHAIDSRYGAGLDAQSHGESFLKLFQSRVVPGGLYLLDEPEAPLSPMRQIAFLAMLKDMVAAGSQFVIATHSPIILSHPGAAIWSFDRPPIKTVAYSALEHVQLTKSFLNNPQAYLSKL
jgi:predicted ATPase